MDSYSVILDLLQKYEQEIDTGIWPTDLDLIISNLYQLYSTYPSPEAIDDTTRRLKSCLVKAVKTKLIPQDKYGSLFNCVQTAYQQGHSLYSVVHKVAQGLGSLYSSGSLSGDESPYTSLGLYPMFILLDYNQRLVSYIHSPEFMKHTFSQLRSLCTTFIQGTTGQSIQTLQDTLDFITRAGIFKDAIVTDLRSMFMRRAWTDMLNRIEQLEQVWQLGLNSENKSTEATSFFN